MTPPSSHETIVDLSLLQRTQPISFLCPRRMLSDCSTVRSWSRSFSCGSDQMNKLLFSEAEMARSSSNPAKQQASLHTDVLLKSGAVNMIFPVVPALDDCCWLVGRLNPVSEPLPVLMQQRRRVPEALNLAATEPNPVEKELRRLQ